MVLLLLEINRQGAKTPRRHENDLHIRLNLTAKAAKNAKKIDRK